MNENVDLSVFDIDNEEYMNISNKKETPNTKILIYNALEIKKDNGSTNSISSRNVNCTEKQENIIVFGRNIDNKDKLSIVIRDIPYIFFICFKEGVEINMIKNFIISSLQNCNIDPSRCIIEKTEKSQWFKDSSIINKEESYNGACKTVWKIIYSSSYDKISKQINSEFNSKVHKSNIVNYITGSTYTPIERYKILHQSKICLSIIEILNPITPIKSKYTRYGNKEYTINCSDIKVIRDSSLKHNIKGIHNYNAIQYKFNENIDSNYTCCIIRTCPILLENSTLRRNSVYDINYNSITIGSICVYICDIKDIINNKNKIGNREEIINSNKHKIFNNRHLLNIQSDKKSDIQYEEKIMLKEFCKYISNCDPDLIIGHDIDKDLNLIINKCRHFKLFNSISLLNRLCCKTSNSSILQGRSVLDIKSFYQSSNISTSGTESYLTYSLYEIIKRQENDMPLNTFNDNRGINFIPDNYDVPLFRDMSNNILYYCINDNFNSLKERLVKECLYCSMLCGKSNCILLYIQVCSMSWCPLNVCFKGSNSKINEWILIKEMIKNNWLIPDDTSKLQINDNTNISGVKRKDYMGYIKEESNNKNNSTTNNPINNSFVNHIRRETTGNIKNNDNQRTDNETITTHTSYKGGKVFVPDYGLHCSEKFLLDFKSMYPSILIKNKICFSDDKENTLLPQIMDKYISKRDKSKKCILLKGDKNDIKQQALKLSSNSLYGGLAYKNFRFYRKSIAEQITKIARNILKGTRMIVESDPNIKVIYGDTDSICISFTYMPNGDNINIIIKKIISTTYDKYHITLKLESAIKKCFIYTKKTWSYIIPNSENQKENIRMDKGMITILRNAPKISKDIINEFLGFIFSYIESKEHLNNDIQYIAEYISKLIIRERDITLNSRPLEDFIIYKSLGRNLRDYIATNTNKYTSRNSKYANNRNSQHDKLSTDCNIKSLPQHVRVSLWLMDNNISIVSKGDSIPYILCEGNQVAHPFELKYYECGKIIDRNKYLKTAVISYILSHCQKLHKNLPDLIRDNIK